MNNPHEWVTMGVAGVSLLGLILAFLGVAGMVIFSETHQPTLLERKRYQRSADAALLGWLILVITLGSYGFAMLFLNFTQGV